MSNVMQLFILLAVSALGGCDWQEPLAPDRDPTFAARNQVPAAPTELTTTAYSHSEIGMAWRDNSTNETGFEVERSTTGAGGPFLLFTTYPANSTAGGNGGLTGSTEYCYRIRAVLTKTRGRSISTIYSEFTDISCVTTHPIPVPAAPSSTSAKPTGTNFIEVTWAAADDAHDGFRVQRSSTVDGPFTTVATLGAAARSHTENVRSEQLMCYRIIAYNRYGESAASNVDCTAAPMWPTNVTATLADDGAVRASWTDASSFEDGFEVRRRGNDGVWHVVGSVPPNTTSYRDDQVLPDSRYSYVVLTTRDGGYSYWSNEATITTLATVAPTAPDVQVSPGSSTTIDVRWSGSSVTAESFRIERSTDGEVSWLSIGTVVKNQEVYTDEGRATEQPVCYRVYAANSVGESPPSVVDCTTPPAAPTDLHTVPVHAWVEVRWTDNSAAEDGYELLGYYLEWYCDDMGNNCDYYPIYYTIAVVPPNTTSYQINDWEYIQAVAAIKDGGYSDWATLATTSAGTLSARTSSTIDARSRERSAESGPVRRPADQASARRRVP